MVDLFLTIDGEEVRIPEGANLVAAARAAGIFVPTLCHLADLPPAPSEHACGVCLVEVEGEPEPVRACETPARPGLAVRTTGEDLAGLRRAALERVLGGLAESARGVAAGSEIVRLADAVGLPADLLRYVPAGVPVEEDPLFAREPDLCVRCGRCVRACEHLRGVAALELVEQGGAIAVVPRGGSVAASGCRYCGTCVEVCPTGARRDAGHPAGVDVPLFVALAAEGRLAEAAAVVRNHVPFPSILGHVCPRPCEDACRRGKLSDPMAISDLALVAGEVEPLGTEAARDTGRSVAVVGSGPAGLSAAFYLRQLGHAPTVFEAGAEPGGSLREELAGRPGGREALARELTRLREAGVAFATDLRVGEDPTFEALATKFDAVVLATGPGAARPLHVPGTELRGVAAAEDFLRSVAGGEAAPEVAGRRVAVIGGGRTAMAAAAAAARAGAEQVDVFCLEKARSLPAHPAETAAAEAAGVRLHPGWGVAELVAAGGRVGGVELVKCIRARDRRGQFAPEYDAATFGRVPAEVVLVAMGHEAADPWPGAGEAGVPVVRAGAVERGPVDVATAFAAGRVAAIATHRALGFEGGPPEYAPARRPGGRRAPVPDFASVPRVDLPLTVETVAAEADRCLRCDLRFHAIP